MESSVTYLLVGTVVLAVTSALYLVAIRPRLRAARLQPFRDALASAIRQRPVRLRCDEQDQILDALRVLEAADRQAEAAERRAQAAEIPTLPAVGAEASQDEQMKSLASFLQDPRVALAVAGGEQLVGNLFAMAVPGAATVLGEAAMHGFWDGVQAVLTSPKGLFELGLEVWKHSMQEGGIHAKQVAWNVAEHVLKGAAAEAGNQVWDQVGDAFDLSGADGAHFPVVTALLSSYREIRLLKEEKTSIERAVGHIALDTGATAAGSLAGAKAGAAVGTFIAPGVGTAIGGFVGAVFGGVGGRMFATTVKEQPLKEAVAAYSEVIQAAEATVTASNLAVLTEVRQQCTLVQANYKNAFQPAPRLNGLTASDALISRTLQLRVAVEEHLRTLIAERDAALQRAQSLIPAANGLHRMLGLDVIVEAMGELSAARAELESAECIPAPAVLPDPGTTKARPLTACRLLATMEWPDSQALRSQFRPIAGLLEEMRGTLMHTLGMWAGRTAQSYRLAVSQITTCLEIETDRHLTVVATQREGVRVKRDAVEKYRAALGR